MPETRDEMAQRLFQFHAKMPVGPMDYVAIEDFHELACAFALERFKAKRTNDEPVLFWLMRRPGYVHVLETPWQNSQEKHAVQTTIRKLCMVDPGMLMIASIAEAWVAVTDSMENYRAAGSEVRNMADHEDCLFVSTQHRDGPEKMTQWVVKLKRNPAHNRVLERDDIDMNDVANMSGAHFGMFKPERQPPELKE